MSQAGEINTAAGPVPPFVATEYVTNDGNFAVPALSILNVLGNNTPSPANNGFQSYTTSSGNTVHVNSYGVAKWIVNPIAGLGTHQTISSAITSASSGDTIFITDGTYTENPVLKAGVNLYAFNPDDSSVIINGKCTMTTAGSVTICGLTLQTNSDYLLEITGSAASIVILEECYLNITNHTAIYHTSSSASSAIHLNYCQGDITTTGITLYISTSSGFIYAYYSDIEGSGISSTPSTMTVGVFFGRYSYFAFTFSFTGTSSSIQLFQCELQNGGANATCITFNSTVSNGGSADNCFFSSDTAPCLSVGAGALLVVRKGVLFSSNINCITGLGTLDYADLLFAASSANINVTTQNVIQSNNTLPYVNAPSSPFTVLSIHQMISVDCSGGAIQVNLPNAPSNFQRFIIKDRTGSAATHNITVTTPGGAVLIDGAATYIIANNYGSITVVFNGSSYEVI